VVVCVLRYDKCRRDYHRTIKSLLYELDARLQNSPTTSAAPSATTPPLPQHLFCDSAPFLERRWAVKAGLGFIGRNHQFFHHTLGSMVHLGEIVIDRVIEGIDTIETIDAIGAIDAIEPIETIDFRFAATPCADCHLCEEACPTGALRNPVWDATRCIAYTTHRCLVCQQACPINKLRIMN
ncbi:MAG: hypothetical protein ACI4UO_01835, partial [Paludibacteraceae bacterium]